MNKPSQSPESNFLALKSSLIFLNDTDEPFAGVLLISSGEIEDLIPESSLAPVKLKEIQANYEFHDLGDSLIFPGIIDLNVHLNSNYEEKWSNIEEVTKIASEGGITTILDHPMMNFYDSEFDEKESIHNRIQSLQGRLYVDCGLLGYLGSHNYKNIKEIYECGDVFGFKLYLSRTLLPEMPVMEKKYLKMLFKKIDKTDSLHGVLLSFDCIYVSDRERFMCSPMRSKEKECRLDLSVEIKKFDKFAGGVHEVIPSSEEMSDESYKCDLEIEDILDERSSPIKESSCCSPKEIDKLKIKSSLVAKSQKENAIANLESMQYNTHFSINEIENESDEDEFNKAKHPIFLSNNNLSSENELTQGILASSDDEIENSTTTSRKANEISEPSPKSDMIQRRSPPKLIFFSENNSSKDFVGNPLKDSIREVYNRLNKEDKNEEKKESDLSNEDVTENQMQIPKNEEKIERTTNETPLENQNKEEEKFIAEENNTIFMIPTSKMFDNSNSARPISLAPSKLYSRRMTVPNLNTESTKTLKKLISNELNTLEVVKNEDKIKEELNNRDYNIYLSNHSLSWESNGLNMIFKNFKTFSNVSILFSNLSSLSLVFSIKMFCERLHSAHNVKLYTEVCVPYLYFHNKMIKSGHTKFKNSPPIRIKEERDLMIQSLKIKNLVDVVSSFHMSCPPEYKRIDKGNFRRCFNGLSNIGYNLQVLWTKLYLREKKNIEKNKNYEDMDEIIIDRKRYQWIFRELIKKLCVNPAKVLGIENKKGRIQKGCQADIVVWNPFKITVVDQKKNLASPKMFLFNNRKLYGEVTHTFLRGKLIYKAGENINVKAGRVMRKN